MSWTWFQNNPIYLNFHLQKSLEFFENLRQDQKNVLGGYLRKISCEIIKFKIVHARTPRYFCSLDVATFKKVFLDLKLHLLQLATSNSQKLSVLCSTKLTL